MPVNQERLPICRQGFLRAIPPCKRGGYVYFIGDGGMWVKIGWTQQDIDVRLSALQNGNPHKLEVLCTTPGPVALESAYHTRFKCFRHTGEWFLRAQPILDEIEKIKRGDYALRKPRQGAGKLTEVEALEIYRDPEGIGPSALAAKFQVSRMMVNKIQRGKAWKGLWLQPSQAPLTNQFGPSRPTTREVNDG